MIAVIPLRPPRPNRSIWDSSKATRATLPMAIPELELWTDCIKLHMQDAASINTNGDARRHRADARQWLRGQLYRQDFLRILSWLDIDEGWWFDRILPALEAKWLELDGETRH